MGSAKPLTNAGHCRRYERPLRSTTRRARQVPTRARVAVMPSRRQLRGEDAGADPGTRHDVARQHGAVDDGVDQAQRARGGPRHSSTACHSGRSLASGSTASGSCSTGKNVPENRNMGMTTTRKMVVKMRSESCAAEKAHTGAAKARPPITAAGTASTPAEGIAEQGRDQHEQGGVEGEPGADPPHVAQVDLRGRHRRGRRRGRCASTGPPMTGHSELPVAACRPVAHRMPGVTNTR